MVESDTCAGEHSSVPRCRRRHASELAAAIPDTARVFTHALVLEDNVLIAADLEGILRRLGIPNVHLATDCVAAEGILGRTPIDVAILDVDLGSESSAPIADRLRERGVSFVFASGYEDIGSLKTAYPGAELLIKPCHEDALRLALGAL